jgi:hypothetical protein
VIPGYVPAPNEKDLYKLGQGVRAAADTVNSCVYVVGQSAVAVSHSGDTNETTLGTITVPAKSMGPNGRVRITTLWSHTSSANNKTLKVKFGSTVYTNVVDTTTASAWLTTMVANRNATNSQVGPAAGMTGEGSSTSAVVTSGEDTTANVTIAITGQLAVGTETVTLEAYVVELMSRI